MNHLTPFDRDKNYMRSLIESFFNDSLGFNLPDIFTENAKGLSMRTDIKETDKEYIIEAEIPGFNKEQIDVTVNNGYLTIKAKREDIVNEEREGYIRKERSYGTFQRSFKLENVKEDEIKAQYENGILKLILPKLQHKDNRSKRIDIQ